MPRKLSAAMTFALASLVIGCGSEVDRKDLSGQVTFAGKPIAYGQIMFMPETKAKLAPTGEAEIVDGRFDTSAPGGRGIIPGPHQVRVTAYAARPPEAPDDETLPSLDDPPIFSGYVFKADVKAGENSFDVPEEAKGFGLGTGQPTRRANDP
jgi:hypothetical protein